MNTYTVKYQRKGQLLRRTLKGLIGHRYDETVGKMVFYFEDGSIQEVPHWHECGIMLGKDWVLYTKRQMEKQAGQPIPLAVEE